MIIKPNIRMNVHMTTHPLGIKESVKEQIEFMKKQNPISNGPKTALIVGGSAGYGLASRISLAWGSQTKTISVSRGGAPKGKRTGSAGYWNCHWFKHFAKEAGIETKDFFGDAFSNELKDEVAQYIKDKYGQIDLLVYSLASGVRINPETKEKVVSSLKPIGKDIDTHTIDIATGNKKPLKITGATQEEIDNTVYCMGGGDWKLWIDFLKKYDLLTQNFKTVAYTYIGGDATKEIYRNGTIGKAKEDLEATANKINQELQEINGQALVSVSKAIVTKASVFIPSMVIYGSALFEVSLNKGLHESVIEHKYRLFNEMIYGDNILLDEKGRIRLDARELDEGVQKETMELMKLFDSNPEEFFNLKGTKLFISNFYKINGFSFKNIDYDKEIDILSI